MPSQSPGAGEDEADVKMIGFDAVPPAFKAPGISGISLCPMVNRFEGANCIWVPGARVSVVTSSSPSCPSTVIFPAM